MAKRLRDNDELMASAEAHSNYKRIPIEGEMSPHEAGVRIGDYNYSKEAADTLYGHLQVDKRFAHRLLGRGDIDPLAYTVNHMMRKVKPQLDMIVTDGGYVRDLIDENERLLDPKEVVHTLDELMDSFGEDIEVQNFGFQKDKSWIDVTFPTRTYDVGTNGQKKVGDSMCGGVAVDFSQARRGFQSVRAYWMMLACLNGMQTVQNELIHNYRNADIFINVGLPNVVNVAEQIVGEADRLREMRKIKLHSPAREARQIARNIGLSNELTLEVLDRIDLGSPGYEWPVENLFDLTQLITYTAQRMLDAEEVREVQRGAGQIVHDSREYHSCPTCFTMFDQELKAHDHEDGADQIT